jgi:hypothetical protein
MKKCAVFLVSAFVAFSAQAKQDFSCPADGVSRSIEEMYKPMQIGMVWGYAGSQEGQIVFVDELNELYDSAGKLTKIGETFVDSSTGDVDFRGAFKIGYDYSAKECRRQIVLEKEIGPGVWEGHTAIEICSPEIMGIFDKVKGKSFDDVWKVLEPLAVKIETAANEMYEKINAEDGVCYQTWDNATNAYVAGKNYDQVACEKANEEQYALSDKGSRLRGLEINEYNSAYVEYAKDENGIVLPRFKVKLKEFFFRRLRASGYNEETGESIESKVCSMNVMHSVDYAGLASQYNWHFSYETSMTAKTWTYDAKNQSVLGKTYEQMIEEFQLLDIGEYFYQSPYYGD